MTKEQKDKKEEATVDQMVEEQVDQTSPQSEGAEEERNEVDELKDKYLRLFAEFDNYKKRTARERLDLIRNAAEDIVTDLLPVLDDFERAKKNASQEQGGEPFSEGVRLVYQKLHNVLESKGLKEMDTSVDTFDPELHEAITKIPAPNPEQKGKIIDYIEKGYYLNDKIIRHAKVVIGE